MSNKHNYKQKQYFANEKKKKTMKKKYKRNIKEKKNILEHSENLYKM